MPSRHPSRLAAALVTAGALALLSGCNARDNSTVNDDVKRDLDQLVQMTRDSLAAAKDSAAADKAGLEELRKMSARMEAVEKATRDMQAAQKRAAIYLPMEAETVCDNDASCTATARAVCNRIGYPKGITSRYTPGTRATLNSVVCFE